MQQIEFGVSKSLSSEITKEIDIANYETIILENATLQISTGKNKSKILINPKNSDQNIYGLYYWIFPNLMLNFYSWGLSINIIEPINKEKTRIKFLSFPIKGKLQPSNTDSSLEKVEKEDQNIVRQVQKGIKSTFYTRGRYSVKYEKGVHYFHRLIARYIN